MIARTVELHKGDYQTISAGLFLEMDDEVNPAKGPESLRKLMEAVFSIDEEEDEGLDVYVANRLGESNGENFLIIRNQYRSPENLFPERVEYTLVSFEEFDALLKSQIIT